MQQHLMEKWDAVINHGDLPQIKDAYKRQVTAQLLENQEKALVKRFQQAQLKILLV